MSVPKRDLTRACRVCGVRDIPFGVEWFTWVAGGPAHSDCARGYMRTRMGVEFGFKQAEKGLNLEATIEAFNKVFLQEPRT